jgi:hypothetical protein
MDEKVLKSEKNDKKEEMDVFKRRNMAGDDRN